MASTLFLPSTLDDTTLPAIDMRCLLDNLADTTLQVPSNIILKKVAPSTWLAAIMFLWGIVTIGQGLVQNQAGLIAMRLLLGLFEAGFFPGCVYLISMYYKRYELQWRLNLFFCGAILAGAFSGLLAYAIANLDGLGGYGGWRWIFIMFVDTHPPILFEFHADPSKERESSPAA
jgi:MFS family permease